MFFRKFFLILGRNIVDSLPLWWRIAMLFLMELHTEDGMNDNINKAMIAALRREIETAVNRRLATPKDFDALREMIFSRLHILVSATTLKRIWGYLDDNVCTRRSTLDILARYVGYADFEAFENGAATDGGELPSNPIMARRIDVDEQLQPGDLIRLTWQPGRVCDVEYRGERLFCVVASQNTRLCAGNTFKCSLMIEDEPLYIDSLIADGSAPVAYVCGKRSGIRFEPLSAADDVTE